MKNNQIRLSFNLFLILLITLAIAIFYNIPKECTNNVFASSSESHYVSVKNLDSSIIYNYINKPNHIALVSENNFFLTDEKNDIYRFSNGNLSLISSDYRDLIDIYYYDNALYILKRGLIIKYDISNGNGNTLYSDEENDTTYLDNPVNIVVKREAYYVANSTSIVCFNFNLANIFSCKTFDFNATYTNLEFEKIHNIYINSYGQICILHTSETQSSTIITKFETLENTFVQKENKIISNNIDSTLKLSGYKNIFTISNNNNLYFCTDDTSTINLFADTSHTPLIKSATINDGSSFKSGNILNISDYYIDDTCIYICDDNIRSNSVQKFRLKDDKLEFENLLIASCSADNNRLYLPNDMCFDQNNLYILDGGNNRFIIKNLANNYYTETKDTDISSPIAMDVNVKGEIFVVSNGTPNQKLTIFTTPKKSISLQDYKIYDIQASYDGKLYMLDKVNKKLLCLDKDLQIYELLDLSERSFSQSARIKLNASGNKIYLLADNTIYNIDLTKSMLSLDNSSKFSTSSPNNIVDFVLDYKDNLYCLQEKSGSYQMNRISSSGTELSPTITLPNIENVTYRNISFDICSGIIYNCDTTNHKIETIEISNIFEILNNFATDYTFKNNPTATGATIASINANCNSYKYPFYAKSSIELQEGDKVIVLNKKCSLNENFAYIMISDKRINNVLAYVDSNVLNYDIEETPADFNKIRVYFRGSANVYLYYLPTGLDFEDIPESFKYPRMAKLNEEFTILGLACGYKDASGMQYYTVKLENGDIVYIKRMYALDANETKLKVTLQSNAKIEKNTESDKLILYSLDEETNTFIPTELELKNNQSIQVMSISSENNKYALIKFEDDKGNLITGYYVETKYIVYNDITWLQIVGIILGILAIILIIITSIIIIRNVKKKKILNLESE